MNTPTRTLSLVTLVATIVTAALCVVSLVADQAKPGPTVPLAAYSTTLRELGECRVREGQLTALQADVIEGKLGDLAWAKRQFEAANPTLVLNTNWTINSRATVDGVTPVK